MERGGRQDDFWEANNVLYLDLDGGLHEYVNFIKIDKSLIKTGCQLIYVQFTVCIYIYGIYIGKEFEKLENKF